MSLIDRLFRVTSFTVFVIAISVLIGWNTGNNSLKTLFMTNGRTMNPASAICFLFLSFSLVSISKFRLKKVSWLLSSVPLIVGLLQTFGYLFLNHFNIDQLFFKDQLEGNLMSPHTAKAFILASSAVFLFNVRGRRNFAISPLLALAVAWLALLTGVGYIYNVDVLSGADNYFPMAPSSAIAFLFFSSSMLLALPSYEPTRTFISTTNGGRIARILIPPALLFPIFSGWLRMFGESLGLYENKLGVTIFVLINVAVWGTALWITSYCIDKAELKNKYLMELIDKKAKIDILTGLWNRRYFVEHLDAAYSSLKRHNRVFSCIIADIDFFKKVNDSFGHGVGDIAIKTVGDILLNLSRKEDVVCRYGGEEFVILLPDTTEESAALLAERIRLAIENTVITNGHVNLHVTCSFGVAEAHKNSTTVVDMADANLYEAKRLGRNQVVAKEKSLAA